MQDTHTSIAFIGLGVMGAPIARRLRLRHPDISGYDLSSAAQQEAERNGIHICASVAACVRKADVIFTMLPSVAASMQVASEVVQHARRGSTLVELGTIGSEAARENALLAHAAGIAYLDAPVINGGQQGAEAGTLKVLAGGEASVVAAMNPVLRAFSTDTFHMGPAGSAQTMKLLHNMLLAAITAASAEALVLAEQAGIGAERALDILRVSSARSFALEWLFAPAVRNDFSGGAKVDILAKDLHLGIQEASHYEVTSYFAGKATELYDQCREKGWGKSDMSVVLKLLADQQAVPA